MIFDVVSLISRYNEHVVEMGG